VLVGWVVFCNSSQRIAVENLLIENFKDKLELLRVWEVLNNARMVDYRVLNLFKRLAEK
jgi:hypothetical protein